MSEEIYDGYDGSTIIIQQHGTKMVVEKLPLIFVVALSL